MYSIYINITVYEFENVLACGCNDEGSVSTSCDSNGRCDCKTNVIGTKCDVCSTLETIGFPACEGKRWRTLYAYSQID